MNTSEESPEQKNSLLIKKVESIVDPKWNFYSNLGNIIALLKELKLFWVGTYIVQNTNLFWLFKVLQLAPYSKKVRGCGQSWKRGTSILVPDVELFDGHISCNPRSKSEIVVPLNI